MAGTPTSAPFDLSEPIRILDEVNDKLHAYSHVEDADECHKLYLWFGMSKEMAGWGVSFRRLSSLRAPLLLAVKAAGLSIEEARSVHSRIIETIRELEKAASKMLTPFFVVPRRHLVSMIGEDATDEELIRAAAVHNGRILDTVKTSFYAVRNAYADLARDIPTLSGKPKKEKKKTKEQGKTPPIIVAKPDTGRPDELIVANRRLSGLTQGDLILIHAATAFDKDTGEFGTPAEKVVEKLNRRKKSRTGEGYADAKKAFEAQRSRTQQDRLDKHHLCFELASGIFFLNDNKS